MRAMHSIYRQVLGVGFDDLPPELRRFHESVGRVKYSGSCRIEGAKSLTGRFVAWMLGLPRSAERAALTFELEASAQAETWQRHFPGKRMQSLLRASGNELVERLGPVDLHFELAATGDKLSMLLRRVTFLGMKLPAFLVPRVLAEETTSPGKLHFNVDVAWPSLGRLVAYQGELNLASQERLA
jgi:hypothetical protein